MTMTPKRKLPWKAVFLLPVFLLPLTTAVFYGLNGGGASQTTTSPYQGLNTQLPGSLPDNADPLDKLSIYQLTDRDSLQRAQDKAADPFWGKDSTPTVSPLQVTDRFSFNNLYSPSGLSNTDANEMRVHQKLAELERQLQTPPTTEPSVLAEPHQEPISLPNIATTALSQPSAEPDSELSEINTMIEKVLDMQHPERVTKKLQEQSSVQKDKVFPVIGNRDVPVTDLLGSLPLTDSVAAVSSNFFSGTHAAFYEWSASTTQSTANNAVRAVIHETKTVVSGATIKLRLEQDIFLQGTRIPAGYFVYGKGNLAGDRYSISISNIRYQNAIYPVNLEVYGMDGMAGICIDGAIGREVLRTGTNTGIQGIQLSSLDPSLKAQVAAGAIEAAKTFFGRKLQLTNVTLKAGEPVLLKDSNQQ